MPGTGLAALVLPLYRLFQLQPPLVAVIDLINQQGALNIFYSFSTLCHYFYMYYGMGVGGLVPHMGLNVPPGVNVQEVNVWIVIFRG